MAVGGSGLDDAVAYVVALRRRVQGRPEAVAIADRCLALLLSCVDAGPDDAARVTRELRDLRRYLEARFGVKSPTLH